MPRQTSQGEFIDIKAHGPKAELVPSLLISEITTQATVTNGTTWTSGLYSADGYYDVVVGLTLSQNGNLKILRYIDDAGTVALDAGQSQALTAATAAALVVTDGKPFASFKIAIQNTGGSPGNITNVAALLSAH